MAMNEIWFASCMYDNGDVIDIGSYGYCLDEITEWKKEDGSDDTFNYPYEVRAISFFMNDNKISHDVFKEIAETIYKPKEVNLLVYRLLTANVGIGVNINEKMFWITAETEGIC